MSNFVVIGQTVAEIWKCFDFFKMAAVRYLGFVGENLDHPRRVLLMVFFVVQNLIGIGACSFRNMNDLYFVRLA